MLVVVNDTGICHRADDIASFSDFAIGNINCGEKLGRGRPCRIAEDCEAAMMVLPTIVAEKPISLCKNCFSDMEIIGFNNANN